MFFAAGAVQENADGYGGLAMTEKGEAILFVTPLATFALNRHWVFR